MFCRVGNQSLQLTFEREVCDSETAGESVKVCGVRVPERLFCQMLLVSKRCRIVAELVLNRQDSGSAGRREC